MIKYCVDPPATGVLKYLLHISMVLFIHFSKCVFSVGRIGRALFWLYHMTAPF